MLRITCDTYSTQYVKINKLLNSLAVVFFTYSNIATHTDIFLKISMYISRMKQIGSSTS